MQNCLKEDIIPAIKYIVSTDFGIYHQKNIVAILYSFGIKYVDKIYCFCLPIGK